MEIVNRIKNKLIKYGVALRRETSLEKDARASLLEEIGNIPDGQDAREDAWNKYRRTLRLYIAKNDPRNFLRWDPIIGSMFHMADVRELDYLKNHNWELWRDALNETWAGNPPRYPGYRETSGNLVHTAYNLALLLDAHGIDLRKLKSIAEFGAGYGLMARTVRKLGFSGSYEIFDIPEFLALQKYYLRTTETSGDFSYADRLEKISRRDPDILIGTWSLSESPIELRNKFFEKIGKPAYVLLAYQTAFGQIDNKKYFAEYMRKNPEYSWSHSEIRQLPGNYYIIGKRSSVS